MSNTSQTSILFVCRHNSFRSQIAQTLANKIGGGKVQAYSAGVEPTEVPQAIQDWAKAISDSNNLKSQPLENYTGQRFDFVITLCDKSHAPLTELNTDTQHIRWDFHHPDNPESLSHLEIEIAERLRLMFLANGIIN